MTNRPFTAIAAVAVFLAAGAYVVMSFTGLPPRVDSAIHKEIGRTLAQEALALRGPDGKLTVLVRDTAAFPQPAFDIARSAFDREIRRGGATVAAVQLLQEDPLRPLQVPSGDFFELIRRSAVGDVIVSFMGPPLLTDEQRANLTEIKPKIVAFCPGNMPEYINLRQLAQQQLLHAGVLSRPLKPMAAGAPRAGPESFSELYRRVDAKELAQLPEPGNRL
ncbi:MAG TPA: hypothetical protein PLX89_03550 [Verrucomicrobiota bacterium]|nr:hypothetical protein [Verrucomicrobiales bacterium]HRI12058.1 hypothetical protein [Verrucomicrobiota bacterium]